MQFTLAPNTQTVLIGVTLLGIACGVIGSFAVLRRRALVGDAIAHAALPGVCVAYFVVGERSLPAFLLGALCFGLLGVLCLGLIKRFTRVKDDAATAIVLSSFFGLGLVLTRIVQNQPSGNRAGLDTFLFGKAAGMVNADVILVGGVSAVAVLVVVVLFKDFLLVSFDGSFAQAGGLRGGTIAQACLDFLMMALLCLVTAAGLPAVGVVLVVALLTIPAAAARFWTDRLGVMIALSAVFGAVAGGVGVAFSASATRLSTGPLITLAAVAVFIVSLLFGSRRGIVRAWTQRRRMRHRVVQENLLRALYELDEVKDNEAATLAGELAMKRSWSSAVLEREVRRAERQGLVSRVSDDDRGMAVTLTPKGAASAAEVVKAHRLWELYLIDGASIAPDHVDRDADAVEHVLPPELVSRLEAKLRAEGRLPEQLPTSPHTIVPSSAGAHD
jgi:manganese/zinc/iron transport system permease protein